MAKPFDLSHEINLHYENTTVLHKKRGEKKFTPFHLHYSKPYAAKNAIIKGSKFDKKFGKGWGPAKSYVYEVTRDMETAQNTESEDIFKLEYPSIRGCLKVSPNRVCILNKSTKRQWLWGQSDQNTVLYDTFIRGCSILNQEDTDLIKSVFFPEPLSFVESMANIDSGLSTVEALSRDIFITTTGPTPWLKNKINLFYKQHKIGYVNGEAEAILPCRLGYMKNKLNMFPYVHIV